MADDTDRTNGHGNAPLSPGVNPDTIESGGSNKLPLFYRALEPLSSDRHASKGIGSTESFQFAADTNSIPLQIQEFPAAAHTCPIVFAGEDEYVPLAVMGIRSGENLFVSDEDLWLAGAYVPAYIRRYPFLGARIEEQEGLTLAFDPSSEVVVDIDDDVLAKPFFTNGEPNEVVQNALELCVAYEQQMVATKAFVAEANRFNLFTPQEVSHTSEAGEVQRVTGYHVIDERKFEVLADEVILEWRSKGWLGVVYAHLISLGNFAALFARSLERAA